MLFIYYSVINIHVLSTFLGEFMGRTKRQLRLLHLVVVFSEIVTSWMLRLPNETDCFQMWVVVRAALITGCERRERMWDRGARTPGHIYTLSSVHYIELCFRCDELTQLPLHLNRHRMHFFLETNVTDYLAWAHINRQGITYNYNILNDFRLDR